MRRGDNGLPHNCAAVTAGTASSRRGRNVARFTPAMGVPGWLRQAGMALLLCCLLSSLCATPPDLEITGVTQARAGAAKVVTVRFRCRDAEGNPLNLALLASADGGATWNAVPVRLLSGDRGMTTTDVWRGGSLVWAAGRDWPEQVSTQMQVKLTAEELPLPPTTLAEFARIPKGSFTMGNQEDDAEGSFTEQPPHTVQVSEFYMGKCEVTRALWDRVAMWAVAHGYEFQNEGRAKEWYHPVYGVNWFDVAKWCNARSEQDGRQPCYLDSGSVFREGQPEEVTCDWLANGYRLPTEAEWEKAARGGLTNQRFPWGNTIDHDRANYVSTFLLRYDKSHSFGYHPDYREDGLPYTSAVGSFPPNAYGLVDIAGNAWEWCWDWFDSYPHSAQVDPHGHGSGVRRVIRGGSYADNASYCRVAARNSRDPGAWGGASSDCVGFRLAIMTP